MAKNILQRRWNGTSWEEIHPITKADNVIDSDGVTVQERLTTDATTSERGMMSAADKQLSANRDGYGTTAGTATAYTVTLTPAPTLVESLRVMVKLHVNNGANPTLNVNGLGAKAIRKANGSAPPSGLLKSGSVYTLVYDGSTAFILQGEGGEYGTAVAADVLAGKTIGTESGLVTGTMVDRAGDTAAVSSAVSGTTLRLRASEGYRDGTNDYVTLTDADFIAANIRKDVNLFGLVGSLVEGGVHKASFSSSGTINLPGLQSTLVATQNVSGFGFTPKFVALICTGNFNGMNRVVVACFSPDNTNYATSHSDVYMNSGFDFSISVGLTNIADGSCTVNVHVYNTNNNTRQHSGSYVALIIG